jgi:translation initiation factor 2 alpha subunit (eIF-2alpha)
MEQINLQEGDVIICTVEKIEGTTVFVTLPNNEQGTIITSEIAPGRIRNLREYVVPKKKIVCKVLRIVGNRMELSLRRVTTKEKQEIMSKLKQEQTAKSAFYQILKENAKPVEEKILQKFSSLNEFLLKAKENEAPIAELIPKEFQESIKKIITKKQKEVEVKKIIKLKCIESDGITRIKKILDIKDEKIKIIYLAAGKFQVTLKAENYKEANHNMNLLAENLEKCAKEKLCELEIEEK